MPVLASLGVWQLDRAAQKKQLQEDFTAQMAAAPVAMEREALAAAAARYLNVSVGGDFSDENKQFLLDNRVHKGQAGYAVLSPLYLDDQTAVLVNRGWVPVGASREIKPDISLQAQSLRMVGIAAVPPRRLSLGDALTAGEAWPKVLQHEDFEAMSEVLGVQLVPRIMQPAVQAPWSFERVWRAVETGPEKNYAYALQWFALALALVVLVLCASFKRFKPDEKE